MADTELYRHRTFKTEPPRLKRRPHRILNMQSQHHPGLWTNEDKMLAGVIGEAGFMRTMLPLEHLLEDIFGEGFDDHG